MGEASGDRSNADPIVTARKHDAAGSPGEVRYFAPLTSPPKTQAALESNGEILWIDVPLEAVVSDISEATGVEFQFSSRGLEEAAVTRDAEVTLRSKTLTYARALKAILTELDLAYVLYDDYVLVTSREAAENVMETRTYALEDHPLLRRFRDGQLEETICGHIEPEEWPQYGGVGSTNVSVIPGALVVTTHQGTHEKVEAFLAQYAKMLAAYDLAEAKETVINGDAAPGAMSGPIP